MESAFEKGSGTMKNRIFLSLVLILAAVFTFAACQSPVSENPAATKADAEGLPPLSQDLQERYTEAEALFREISFNTLSKDENTVITVGDTSYYRVTDPRFPTYEDFETRIGQYFTRDFIERKILNSGHSVYTEGPDGGLYAQSAERESNMYYAGHVFYTDEQTDDRITLTATAYYSNDNKPYNKKPFHKPPKNPADFTSQKYEFTLVKQDGLWKFDTFSLFY